MIRINALAGLAIVLGLAAVPTANASVVVSYGSQTGGLSSWTNTVIAAGGTASADQLPTSGDGTRPDYTITRTFDSSLALLGAAYSSGPAVTTGGVIDISPSGGSPGNGGSDGSEAIGSGITFTFSNAINGFGFEVGDWATCCQTSNLYISFGNGAPILVGSSTTLGDQFLTDGRPLVFVGAFDDSGTFTTVNFWGDGYGEFLVAGGTVHYVALQEGSLPTIPEPASMALLGAGVLGLGVLRRRRA